MIGRSTKIFFEKDVKSTSEMGYTFSSSSTVARYLTLACGNVGKPNFFKYACNLGFLEIPLTYPIPPAS